MEKLVRLFGVRHGANQGDQLTEEGCQQIVDSMLKNASGIGEVDAVYTSLRKRTWESAICALTSQAIPGFPAIAYFRKRAGFDYRLAPINRAKEFNQAVKDLIGTGPENIGAWELAAPDWTNFLRPRVKTALESTVIELCVIYPEKELLTGIIFSHSPVIELAADLDFPRLRPADIIQYTYEVEMDDTGEITRLELVGTAYLPRD